MYGTHKKTKEHAVFVELCDEALPDLDISHDLRMRCIGWNQQISETICQYIIEGEKVGTFALPWLLDQYSKQKPQIGEYIIQLDYKGSPRALVQVVSLHLVPFSEIDAKHTSLDGPPVRELEVWLELHTKYWNSLLEQFGRVVGPDMPVIVERFRCCHPTG